MENKMYSYKLIKIVAKDKEIKENIESKGEDSYEFGNKVKSLCLKNNISFGYIYYFQNGVIKCNYYEQDKHEWYSILFPTAFYSFWDNNEVLDYSCKEIEEQIKFLLKKNIQKEKSFEALEFIFYNIYINTNLKKRVYQDNEVNIIKKRINDFCSKIKMNKEIYIKILNYLTNSINF